MLVPPAIAAFRAAHPGVELSLEEAEPAAAADGLRDGRFDLAIVFEYDFETVLDPAGIALHPLRRRRDARRAAARPPARGRRARSPMERARAARRGSPAPTPTCNRLLTHGAGRAGFTPRVAFASDDYGAVGRLVLAGVGVALVPGAGGAVGRRRRAAAPARARARARGSASRSRRSRSAAADAMLAMLTSPSGRSTSSAPAAASA